MAEQKYEIDRVTGTATTGHVWDDIRELNTPLPRWWLWLFYATIVWAVGYWIVYPSWPLISGYTRGAFGWQSREAIVNEMNGLKAIRGPMTDKLAETSLQDILGHANLVEFARAQAKPIFSENCAPCHGAGGGGRKGFPNLNDDDWLWGGKLADIRQTIEHGVRSIDGKTRLGGMPAFGREGMLKRPEIEAAAQYTRSLAGLAVATNSDLATGKKVFADVCATCHGADGKGKRDMGAPNLTDAIWLYGSDTAAIVDGLWNGRNGMMPAWSGRLDDNTVKALAVYVYTLGGGEK
jgi:cytochrome c oxidase cbb3-type subunit 3